MESLGEGYEFNLVVLMRTLSLSRAVLKITGRRILLVLAYPFRPFKSCLPRRIPLVILNPTI